MGKKKTAVKKKKATAKKKSSKKAAAKKKAPASKTKAKSKPRPKVKKTDSLMQACGLQGSLAEVKRWLAEGADVNPGGRKPRHTPLELACGCGHYEIARLLLEAGANPNTVGLSSRQTPLISAARRGKTNLKIMRLLIEKGADPNRRPKDAEKVLMAIIGGQEFDIDVAKFLIDNGADIECTGTPWRTPLTLAAEKGHLELVKYLVKKGAKINRWIEPHGRTALANAIWKDHKEIVMFLLSKGADPGDKSGFSGDAFAYAAEHGYIDVLEFLEKRGAIKKNKASCGKALAEAAGKGRMNIVKFLLGKGADPNARSSGGDPPLFYAASEGRLSIARLLVKSGADIHARNNLGWNALMKACLSSKGELAEFLIKKGCDINLVENERGLTPLIIAADAGRVGAVKALVAAGAKLDVKAKNGRTALEWARRSDHKQVAKMLAAAGAKKPAPPKKGEKVCGYCGDAIKPGKGYYCSDCKDVYCSKHYSVTGWAYPHMTVDDKYRTWTCVHGHEDWEKEK